MHVIITLPDLSRENDKEEGHNDYIDIVAHDVSGKKMLAIYVVHSQLEHFILRLTDLLLGIQAYWNYTALIVNKRVSILPLP